MSSPSNVAESPITDRRELVDYLASGARTKADWRIGTEHEKFGFRLDDLRPPTFEGDARHRGAARRPDAFRLDAGRGTRPHHRAARKGARR